MLTPLELEYPNSEPYEVVLLDDRIPGIVERLHRERASWQEQSTIEALDESNFVLVVRPGGVRTVAA